MSDRHLHAREMLHDIHHPYLGDVVLPGSPLRLSAYERLIPELFPEPGAQSEEVLRDWLQLDDERLQDLIEAGVVTSTR